MDDYQKLVAQALMTVDEILPWDLEAMMQDTSLILLDVREPNEFAMMHIQHSINVPRGLLEGACCWNYDDTEPRLANARNQPIVVICRSGNRSALAAFTLQQMGFSDVKSLKLGIKGWNDSDMPMLNQQGEIIDVDEADVWLNTPVAEDKLKPKQ